MLRMRKSQWAPQEVKTGKVIGEKNGIWSFMPYLFQIQNSRMAYKLEMGC